MKMQMCPHCSEEIIYSAKVCSYCMKTITNVMVNTLNCTVVKTK